MPFKSSSVFFPKVGPSFSLSSFRKKARLPCVRETDGGQSGPGVLGRRDAQTCSKLSFSRSVLKVDCSLGYFWSPE